MEREIGRLSASVVGDSLNSEGETIGGEGEGEGREKWREADRAGEEEGRRERRETQHRGSGLVSIKRWLWGNELFLL